jgi:hypothetical protein
MFSDLAMPETVNPLLMRSCLKREEKMFLSITQKTP